MRQARGHRAQRGQPLAVLLHRRQAAHDRRDLLHHPPVHARVREREPVEVLGLDQGDAPGGLGLHPHAERTTGEHRDRAHPRRRPLAADRLLASLLDHQRLDAPGEQEDDAGRLLGLLGEDVAGLEVADVGDGEPRLERGVIEIVEEVDRAEVGHGEGCRTHASTRYW